MNMLKKGPELKLPEVKVPDFLLDVYYDLRERHLLPLVVILLVAIVAIPIALSGSSDSESSPPEGPAAGISSVAPTSDLVVAETAPGLRDYRGRLGDRAAQDPFVQQYAGSAEAGEAAPSSSSTASSEATVERTESGVTYGGSTPPAEPESGSGGGTTTEAKPKTQYAVDTIDVRIVPVASDEAGASNAEPSVRRKVPELTMLPNRDTPVAVFMGASADGKKALLLISSDVQSVFGDGRCVVGSKVCQLLALEEGLPETFVYGPQARTYRLEILKIDRSFSDKPQRASLGEPKKKQQEQSG